MKNLKEFKELIDRYETIQLPEIRAAFKITDCEPQKYLTGFGCMASCTLCNAVNDDCESCVYGEEGGLETGCIDNENSKETYLGINDANSPKQLLTAYRNRAKFMRKLLKEKGGENGTGS